MVRSIPLVRVFAQATILIILLLSIGPLFVRAERLPLKTYSTSDSLASNEINKIFRDSRGFLWFCTAGGLSRFDGYSFINFATENGLPDPVVNDLLETRTSEYWLATNGPIQREMASLITKYYLNDASVPDQRLFRFWYCQWYSTLPQRLTAVSGVL
jgi:hypothetical protein